MANKYCNLIGSNKIKDEYPKINTGFEEVEADVTAVNGRINTVEDDVTAVNGRINTVDADINARVDNIITTPIEGTVAAQEVVDARGSSVSLGARLAGIDSQLADIVVNVKNFGAVGDGINDDAPSIRMAIAHLKTLGGGKLYFPKGIYYVASGDPRGLSGSGIFSNNDFYTCFEIIDNMIVEGVGSASRVLYESNRLGYNLNTLKGDVGQIFSNFRVLGSDARRVVKGNIIFRNIDFEYTELAAGESGVRDYIDGQIIRVIDVGGEKNGKFIFENINIYNPVGHQCVNVFNGEYAKMDNVNLYNIGNATNSANTDFSGCYIMADLVKVKNCKVITEDYIDNGGTAFELHGKHCIVEGNKVKNCNTFINVVGSLDLMDAATYSISKNHVENVKTFCTYWVYSSKKIRSIDIGDNTFIARASTDLTNETLICGANDTGEEDTVVLPVDLLKIHDVKYLTYNKSNAPIIKDVIASVATLMIRNVKETRIENNIFFDVRKRLIDIQSIYLEKLHIKGNSGRDIGWGIPETLPVDAYRSIIYHFNATNNDKLNEMVIENNIFEMNFPLTTGDSCGYRFNNRNEKILTDKNFIINNNVFKGVNKEIQIRNDSTLGQFNNSYLIKHRYNNIVEDTDITTLGVYYAGEVKMLKEGSIAYIPTSNGVVEMAKTNNNFIMIGSRATIPTVGYWSKGSIIKNTNPTAGGYLGWICITGGTPGTWKGFGLIET